MLLRLQLIFVFDLNRSIKCDAQTLFVTEGGLPINAVNRQN